MICIISIHIILLLTISLIKKDYTYLNNLQEILVLLIKKCLKKLFWKSIPQRRLAVLLMKW